MASTGQKLDASLLVPRRELRRYLETSFPDPTDSHASPGWPGLAADPALTAFAQLGAVRLNARTCVISLLSRDTQYIIAESTRTQSMRHVDSHSQGDGILFGICSAATDTSLCGWSVASANKNLDMNSTDQTAPDATADCLIVPDLTQDDRFKDHPVVTGPAALRFYASVPLLSPHSGRGIGSYCVLDDRPRDTLSPGEIEMMRDMAATVTSHLEHARAKLDKSRSEKMVRGIGAFVEGDSSIRDWWSRTSSGLGKKIPKARATADYFANASGIGPNSTMGADRLAKDRRSSDSSPELSPPPHAERRVFGSLSGLATLNRRAIKAAGEKSANVAKDIQAAKSNDKAASASSSVVKTLVSRASNIIREAAELDGVLFVDARMASLRTGRTASHATRSEDETSPSSNDSDPNQPCRLLGFSANEEVHADEVSPATSLSLFPERTLCYMLRRYPKGKILSLEDPSSASESEKSASMVDFDVPSKSKLDGKGQKPNRISRVNEAAIMARTFPGAKSVAFFPLYDSSKERWFSGAFAYTCASLRELTVEGELSYLAAFGNSLMAEVARQDTIQADAAKANFIGAISHELRSPLHGILGSVEMLRDGVLDPTQADLVHNIQVCGQVLLDTVEHLLDFSKMNNLLRPRTTKELQLSGEESLKTGAEGLGFHDKALDVGIVCEEVMQTVSSGHSNEDVGTSTTHDAFSASVALILDIDDPASSVYHCQPGALKRIISNLVSNGQKYTSSGFVRLFLETTCLVPADYEDLDEEYRPSVRITVQDSGKGISKTYLRDRLYTPFAQEDAHAPGTGLGLSIVRQIVQSLRGTIHVESEKELGTTVRISLPMKLATGQALTAEQEAISAARELMRNKSVALVGFDPRIGVDCKLAPPTSWTPAARGLAYLGRSLASFCQASLGVEALRYANVKDMTIIPDACIIDLATARAWTDKNSLHSVPAIVVCPSAQSAGHWTKMKARSFSTARVFYAAQPIGPLRLAKIFEAIFNEQDPRSAVSSEGWPCDHPSPGIPISLPQSENGRRQSDFFSSPTTAFTTFLATGAAPPPYSDKAGCANAESEKSMPAPEKARTNGSLPHVLVVDDNAINLRLLQTFCRRLGFSHDSASNGLEALETYKAAWSSPRPFEYILMDINMPIMDGLQSTRHIRQFEREQEARKNCDGAGKRRRSAIIALTGLDSPASHAEAFESGMDMFLTKPVKFAELKGFLIKGLGEDLASPVTSLNRSEPGDAVAESPQALTGTVEPGNA